MQSALPGSAEKGGAAALREEELNAGERHPERMLSPQG